MRHALKKCTTPRKVGHTWRNAQYLEKCATFGKVQQTWKNAAYFEKCCTRGKMHHDLKKAPNSEMSDTLGKQRHTSPCLEKGLTLGIMWQPWKLRLTDRKSVV